MRSSEASHDRPRVLPAPRLLLVVLFAGALAVRLYHVGEPPLNFHATRQYRSLLIARAYYYDMLGSVSASKAEVARINRERQGILEPPVLEVLVAAAYRLVGGERFWIPRMVSSVFWLVGGVFLYLIARRLVPGRDGPIVAVAVYLFLPFGVVASRSFQPDALMISLLLSSVWAFIRFHDNPSSLSLAVSVLLAAAAVLVKPVSVFVLAVVVGVVEVAEGGLRSVVRPRALGMLTLTILPAVAFYGYGMLASATLQEQARSSWLPALVGDAFFWRGWLTNVDSVIGFPVLVFALIGVLVSRRGLPRHVLVALWAGYAGFCVIFSYHIATHDYYHLQLVPIVALSLAPVVAALGERLADERLDVRMGLRAAVWSIFGFALLTSAVATRARLAARSGLENRPRIAAEIGSQVAHSRNTVYLSSDYGLPLEFHGEFAGRPWPLVSDLQWERLAGTAPVDAKQRFQSEFAPYSPEFFIVADRPEFERQADLKTFLLTNFRLAVDNTDYAIFDLRR